MIPRCDLAAERSNVSDPAFSQALPAKKPVLASLLLGSGVLYACYPAFWAIPTMMLSEAAAAATFGLINSIGQLGGLAGNYTIGYLNDRTHSLTASFGFIAVAYLLAGGLILSLRISDPMGVQSR